MPMRTINDVPDSLVPEENQSSGEISLALSAVRDCLVLSFHEKIFMNRAIGGFARRRFLQAT